VHKSGKQSAVKMESELEENSSRLFSTKGGKGGAKKGGVGRL